MDARVTLKDTDGWFLVANRETSNHVGAPDGMIGKTIHELKLDLGRADNASSWDAEVLRTRRTVRYEEKQSAEGAQKTFLTWKAPVKDDDEGVTAIVTVSTDITEQQRSQEHARRLARENELLAKIGRTVSSAPEIGKIFEDLYGLLTELFPLDSAGVNILEAMDGRVMVFTSVNADAIASPGRRELSTRSTALLARPSFERGAHSTIPPRTGPH